MPRHVWRPSINALLSTQVIAMCAVAVLTARAQSAPSIDPGMTRGQVEERLGTPSSESHAGSFTYLFYDNDCAETCGIDDLVVLERNTVTDAIFRSPKRTYTGISSSPQALQPVPAGHFAAAPLHASTAEDRAHRGGIVFAPRAPLRPPQYIRIVPNHADSARWIGSMSTSGTAAARDASSPAAHDPASSPQ